jgi:3-methyladenine DNA glycosylase AlkD
VRFSIVCLLDYYINESYIDKLTCIVKEVKSNEYYINMALAWLISIMLVKEYDKTLPLLKDGALDLWVHNKSIQKARESYRLSLKQKEELRSLKR